jgi:glycerophosphoryl diester phosphodiesterase
LITNLNLSKIANLMCLQYYVTASRTNKGLLLLIALLTSLYGMSQKDRKPPRVPNLPAVADLQGHRGCRGLMPENTVPAMLKALELGVHTLEMDVVITGDGQVVLSHEPFFNHEISTTPEGAAIQQAEEQLHNIYTMPLAQVQRYDVGLRPHPRFAAQQKMAVCKPTLEQVIDSVAQWCSLHKKPLPFFNIETKSHPEGDGKFHPEPAQFVDALMAVIMAAGLEEKVIIQSFDFRTLVYAHQHYPDIKLAALVEMDDPASLTRHLEKLGFVPDFYSPAYQRVTPAMVQQCKYLNMKLVPWTVNDPMEAARLKMMGVDGLITDYPDIIR